MIELQTKTSGPVVTLTPEAVGQVKRLRTKQGKESAGLRVGVKGGGCSGFSYVMLLDEEPDEDDIVLNADGVPVYVDPKSARLIRGMTIDYSTRNLLEGGWKFSNPNAGRSCGCGTSFTPK